MWLTVSKQNGKQGIDEESERLVFIKVTEETWKPNPSKCKQEKIKASKLHRRSCWHHSRSRTAMATKLRNNSWRFESNDGNGGVWEEIHEY